jgi:hypothetical protein
MRVDPMMQLNEAITSVLEAIAYPSIVVLAVAFLVVSAVELHSRHRPSELKGKAGDQDRRRRSDRVVPAAR